MLYENQDPVSDWGKYQMAQEEVRSQTLWSYFYSALS